MTGILLMLLLGAESAGLRCDDALVTTGATKLEVLSKCGEPDYRERVSGMDERSEEVWIYAEPDSGAQRLLHFIGVDLQRVRFAGVALQPREKSGGFRCADKLVTAGATKLEVRKHCGEPAVVERISGSDEKRREIWLYQPENKLVMQLEFDGVELIEVTTRR